MAININCQIVIWFSYLEIPISTWNIKQLKFIIHTDQLLLKFIPELEIIILDHELGRWKVWSQIESYLLSFSPKDIFLNKCLILSNNYKAISITGKIL